MFQLEAAPRLRDSLFVSPHRRQVICVPLSRARRAAVHLNGSAVCAVGRLPIPLEHRSNAGEHGVCFREFVIQIQRRFGVHFRLWFGFPRRQTPVDTQQME